MPNHNNVRVPKACDYQSIHAKIIIPFVSRVYAYQSIHAKILLTFVFLKHTITRASMPKSQ